MRLLQAQSLDGDAVSWVALSLILSGYSSYRLRAPRYLPSGHTIWVDSELHSILIPVINPQSLVNINKIAAIALHPFTPPVCMVNALS